MFQQASFPQFIICFILSKTKFPSKFQNFTTLPIPWFSRISGLLHVRRGGQRLDPQPSQKPPSHTFHVYTGA